MLDNGTVVEIGSYDELVKKKDGQFNNFIQKFLENNEANKGKLNSILMLKYVIK